MDTKDLGQHIDKISYGIGGIVGLAILVIPFLEASNIDDSTDTLNSERLNLEQKVKDGELPPNQTPWVAQEVERQWSPGSSPKERVEWITERRPGVLVVQAVVERIPSVHEPGSVDSITLERDAEKKTPYLVVKGSLSSENQHVVIDSVKLLRSASGSEEQGGKYEEVSDFEYDGSGSFEYRDYKVEEDKTYAYKFVSMAKLDPSASKNIDAPTSPEQETSVLGPTPVIPHDFNFKLGITFPGTAGGAPECTGTFVYWDYEQGEAVTEKRRFKEGDKIGDRFVIRRIDDQAKMVRIRDTAPRIPKSYDIESRAKLFPVEAWDPIQAVVEVEETDEDDEVVDEAPKPKTKKKKKSRRRKKGFGE